MSLTILITVVIFLIFAIPCAFGMYTSKKNAKNQVDNVLKIVDLITEHNKGKEADEAFNTDFRANFQIHIDTKKNLIAISSADKIYKVDDIIKLYYSTDILGHINRTNHTIQIEMNDGKFYEFQIEPDAQFMQIMIYFNRINQSIENQEGYIE